jgi:preprotein translocase subunit YajC
MFSSPAYAQAATGAPGGTEAFLIQIVPLILLFVIFWFLIIRPQQQKLKAHRAMVDAVKKGDEVITGGGLVGKVFKVTDQEVEIDLSPTVRVKALKSTLSAVTPRGAPAAANDSKG